MRLSDLFDKLVLGTMAAVVSLVVLHGYNVYLNAFESAEPEARAISDLATNKKDEILKAVSNIVSAANDMFYKVSKATNPDAAFRQNISAINSNNDMLGSSFPNARTCVESLGGTLETEIHAKFSGNDLNVTPAAYKTLLTKIADKQEECVKLFNGELAVLLSVEYKSIYQAFYSQADWYSDPQWLLIFCAGAAVICGLVSLFIPRSRVDIGS